MVTSKMYIFGILIIVAGIVATKAEVDCSSPPPFVDFKDCCELSNLISEHIKEKCNNDQEVNFEQQRGPPDHAHGPPGNRRGPPHHHGPHHGCFFNCVVNETGILVDGEIQEDVINSYLNEVFDDSEKVEFVTSKLMSCYEKHKEFESNMPDHGHHWHHGPSDCSPKHGGMLIGCAHMHSFKECPDSYWSNTDECNAVRDHFIQCKRPHHGPHHHEEDVDVEEEDI
ncbi:uncharacterized protein LOC119613596 [Lucilia sericata]|uniref:uncharacterized protein LOC119613596 n=1 Tax=Lucilia sericata TaxID=13632 RepID=UPI0018A87860|nr:uncharacterized protein LOC119613596 [Lucilia sericata]